MDSSADPDIAAVNDQIKDVLSFFGSKFLYEPDKTDPYRGRVHHQCTEGGYVVYTLFLGDDSGQLCVIGLRPENGYRNDKMERALLTSTGIGN